ncbi:FAD-dependent oxidoreductase [Nonomuraea sp. NN258]|uniref:NAD(P)/FAD-dependent oxidoreductase n=1 Tax=Nonomuraea antri TaxID=2730852 RepID=UPI00156968B7|nr:FAD-dependent oxidoreductase [Nonomuraea antri]NRQ37331.1 FAD-dependent oxidoreductase [Nonomuraea antri]
MTHRIVVLGAGYAGLAAAKRAARRLRTAGRARVVLVNDADHFVERVRLHQVAAGQALPGRPLAGLLAGTGIELVIARVTGVDLREKVVRLDRGHGTLGYDTLVYALGSRADLTSVPGAAEHAFGVARAGDAERLRDGLAGVSSVVVVGGGLTGIETAAELATSRPGLKVGLVTAGRIGAGMSGRARRHLLAAFGRMGVDLREDATVRAVTAAGLLLDDGRDRPAEAVVWTAGFRVPALAGQAGLATDEHGRVVVDGTLRSVSHPEVFAIGDAAAAPVRGGPSRMSCQIGLPMGWRAGDLVADLVTGRELVPVRLRYVWRNISLGRHDGVTQFTYADDRPLGPAVLTGRASALFKEAVTRGTVHAIRSSLIPGRLGRRPGRV